MSFTTTAAATSTTTTTAPAAMKKKQGIVSILGCDDETESQRDCYLSTASNSIRRTLSADMSSMKWQSQHGFSPIKKVASSLFISNIPHDEKGGGFETWSSFREEKKKESEKVGSFDALWSSILLQKKQEDNKQVPPPYVHPLVKRSASSLSEKSLEICTESLGSETGSDGFSSYPPSETSDAEVVQEDQEQQHQTSFLATEDFQVVKFNNLAAATSKRSSPRSFPPPIPSLSNRDGASLCMRSHRDSGRLVLEAVSVPTKHNFHAERQDGRLVLSFINDPVQVVQEDDEPKLREQVNDDEQFQVEIEGDCQNNNNNIKSEKAKAEDREFETVIEQNQEIDDEEIEEERGDEGDSGGRCGGVSGEEEVSFLMEQPPKSSSGIMNVHRLALMTNKPIMLANRNPTTWSSKVKLVKDGEEEVVVSTLAPITQSLPPRPPMGRMIPTQSAAVAPTTNGGVASFNAYEYYWKPKAMETSNILDHITKKSMPIKTNATNNKFIVYKNLMANEQQEMIVLRGNKGNYLVPLVEGCKVEKRSLRFWEPYCIATS